MRARKPCSLARWRFLGWYVCLVIVSALGRPPDEHRAVGSRLVPTATEIVIGTAPVLPRPWAMRAEHGVAGPRAADHSVPSDRLSHETAPRNRSRRTGWANRMGRSRQ